MRKARAQALRNNMDKRLEICQQKREWNTSHCTDCSQPGFTDQLLFALYLFPMNN